jgi:hypothetical protein
MDDSLVLLQLIANVEMNADLALAHLSQLQAQKPGVWNCGERVSSALQLLRIDFVCAHPR